MKNTFERLRTLMWFLKKKKENQWSADQCVPSVCCHPSSCLQTEQQAEETCPNEEMWNKVKQSCSGAPGRFWSDLIYMKRNLVTFSCFCKTRSPGCRRSVTVTWWWINLTFISRECRFIVDLVLFFSSVATDGTWTVFSMMFWTGSIWFKPEIWFTQLHFNSVARLMCSQRFKYIF